MFANEGATPNFLLPAKFGEEADRTHEAHQTLLTPTRLESDVINPVGKASGQLSQPETGKVAWELKQPKRHRYGFLSGCQELL